MKPRSFFSIWIENVKRSRFVRHIEEYNRMGARRARERKLIIEISSNKYLPCIERHLADWKSKLFSQKLRNTNAREIALAARVGEHRFNNGLQV